MSGILAGFGPSTRGVGEEWIHSLLGEMAYRGRDEHEIHRWDEGFLAGNRDRWEAGEGFAGPVLVGQAGEVRAVCDATLYYRDELTDAVRKAGVEPRSSSASDLIAASYLAWGLEGVQHLEGDYAFSLWDPTRRRLVCARSPFGARGLFHTSVDGTLLAASTPHPLVEWIEDGPAFDPEGLLRAILLKAGDGVATDWKGVSELPAAHLLVADGRAVRVEPFWYPAGSDDWRGVPHGEVAEGLRGLLDDSVLERLSPGRTAVAMSGGMDSTAIMASAMETRPGDPADIISWRFPDGDPGDESWYVDAVAEQFGRTVHWVDRAGIRFYEGQEALATLRSGSRGHIFEMFNRELARRAAGLGHRVMLNGVGGDEVFALPDWYMADLLRQGRLLKLRRYAHDRGYSGARAFVTHCLRPALPLWVFDGLELVLRRRICSRIFERPLPPWIVASEAAISEIVQADRREYADTYVGRHSTVTAMLRSWCLNDPIFAQNCRTLFDLCRHEGVELRFPFYDRRLVGLSLTRHPEELNQPGRWKVVLADAISGRLPDRSRSFQEGGAKPGTMIGLMKSRWASETLEFVETLSRRPWVLDEMGLVSSSAFQQALADGWSNLKSIQEVTFTALAEAWLRAHS